MRDLNLESVLNKIEVLAMAAGYLSETGERSLQLELIERVEVLAREAAKPDAQSRKGVMEVGDA
jgi:hypothetical protein